MLWILAIWLACSFLITFAMHEARITYGRNDHRVGPVATRFVLFFGWPFFGLFLTVAIVVGGVAGVIRWAKGVQ